MPILNTTSNTSRVVYGGSPSGQYASYTAEGGAATIDTINYDKTNIEIQKATVAPYITNELIEDCEFDVVELELKKAGARLENKLNQQVITTMLAGVVGPGDVTPAGTHIGTLDIGIAKGYVDSFGWMADSVLVQPLEWGYLLDETNMPDSAIACRDELQTPNR